MKTYNVHTGQVGEHIVLPHTVPWDEGETRKLILILAIRGDREPCARKVLVPVTDADLALPCDEIVARFLAPALATLMGR
jgi:hypothetical protein